VGVQCALLIGVCIETDFHISLSYSRELFFERCCNTERRHRLRSALETRGNPQTLHDQCVCTFTGVCIKIDVHIFIACARDACWLNAVAIQNSVAVLASKFLHVV